MNKTFALLLLGALAGAATTTGCFTMIKHPMPELSADDHSSADDECSACHGAEPIAWFPSNNGPWYPPPWWHDHDDDVNSPGVPALDPEGRHAWDRGAGAPYVPPVGGTVAPAPSPSPTPALPSGSDTTGAPPRARDQKKDKDRGRNAWGR